MDADVVWTGLEVTDIVAGDTGDAHGEVEFTAHFEAAGRPGTMRERSRFERRAGGWCYVDGVVR
jgi:SEC-C motif-containing protein